MKQNTQEGSKPFIFLAEDDIDDQELLIEALSQFNNSIVVNTVTNGKKAISYLQQLQPENYPSLIVLDYNLPELSGADILEYLKSVKGFESVSKVVWSTYNSPVYQKICLDLGANAYLVKPNDVSGIQKIAQQMLQMCLVND